VGPSPDGGFHLLGLSAPLPPDVFRGITWSDSEVLERFLANVAALAPAVLKPWPDVDTARDLADYARRNRHRETHTMELIRTFNLAPQAWNT
jgi:hypothetical protein